MAFPAIVRMETIPDELAPFFGDNSLTLEKPVLSNNVPARSNK